MYNGLIDNGTNIQQHYYNGSTAQTWKFVKAEYKVKYDANGGSGAPSAQTKYYKNALKLSSKIPTRTGFKFLGWSTSKTATSAAYNAGSSYTKDKAVTLYAVWAGDFSDVQDPSHPFYDAIYWAADAGITKGYSDGTFGINKPCTRGEMMMFLWRYAGKLMEALAAELAKDGRKAELTCSYAIKWFAKHPEHQDLLIDPEAEAEKAAGLVGDACGIPRQRQ